MILSETPLGLRVAMVEPMGDETRWTFFQRTDGIAKYHPNPKKVNPFVTAVLMRLIQGIPGQKPRYDSGETITDCEVDGRIPVVPASQIEIYQETKPIPDRLRLNTLLAALKSDNPLVVNAIDDLMMVAKLSDIKPAHDFAIGDEIAFTSEQYRWKVTDIGTRTILAIDIDRYADKSWYNGPPYPVPEVVFDEYDLPACEIVKKSGE